MKRLKTFLTYGLLIAAFWIFSNLIIFLAINGTYKTKKTEVYISSPKVTIFESKATYVNGYVKGSIRNNTEETLNNKYLKIDMYSPRDVELGTKYIKIDGLQVNSSKDFEMWYKYTDVDHVIITLIDNAPDATEADFLSEYISYYTLVGILFVLYLV